MMNEGKTQTAAASGGGPDLGLDLESVIRVLRRRWWVILACFVVLGAAAFVYARLQPKQYTASTSVLFGNTGIQQQASGLPNQGATIDPRVASATNVLLLQLGRTAAATAAQIDHGLTAREVTNAITISPQGQSNVVSVSATWGNPATAARIANVFSRQFIVGRRSADVASVNRAVQLVRDQYKSLSRQQRAGLQGQALADRTESLKILAALQTGDVQVAQTANVPTTPSSPKVALDTAIGLLAGLALGLALAFVLERLDRRLRKIEDVEEAFGFSVLGHIQDAPVFARPARADSQDSLHLPVEAESFRMIRAHLRYYNVDRDIKTILVTSIAPGDGKTTIAHNLAQAAASLGTRTLLVEADLRRPQLSRLYGLATSPGVAEVLISPALVREAIQSVPISSSHSNEARADAELDVLVAGTIPPNPSELLESEAMQGLLDWATSNYEFVIIDAPPPAAVSDAIPLIARVSGVLIVTRMGRNTRDGARRLHKTLASLGAPVLGVIVNGIKPSRGHYGYGYGYGYSEYTQAPVSNGKTDPADARGGVAALVGSRQSKSNDDPDGDQDTDA